MQTLRVLIVDDTESIRLMLRRALRRESTEIVGEACDGHDAVHLVEDLAPDLVIMDYDMPGRDGASATEEIKKRWPQVEVLGYTSTEFDKETSKLVAAGASETFDKQAVEGLVGAVRKRVPSSPQDDTRLLIVDDDDDIRMMLEMQFTAGGVKIVGEARTGREAIEMAERLQPNIVVMDLRMPDIDGMEATRTIKSRWPDMQVIGYTAFPTAELDEAGADASYSKTDTEGLIRAVLEFQ